MERRAYQVLRDVRLVREVDQRFDHGQGFDQAAPPGLGANADQPFELPEGLPALRLRFRHNQIGEALDRRQIEPAILEGAARELAPFSRTAARHRTQRLEHSGDDGMSAMDLKLGYVFTRLAVRRRKPERKRFVDDVAGLRIAHTRQSRLARIGKATDQGLEGAAGLRTRYANYRDRRGR